METIKGLISTMVFALKFLIWTFLIIYGLAGLYLLFHGNPSKGTPGYRNIHAKAWSFAAYTFFIAVILIPGLFLFVILSMSNAEVDYDALAPAMLWYIGILGLGSFIGIVNQFIAN